jgi:hypothetical protein
VLPVGPQIPNERATRQKEGLALEAELARKAKRMGKTAERQLGNIATIRKSYGQNLDLLGIFVYV